MTDKVWWPSREVMTVSLTHSALAIGVAGAFGSGCSVAAQRLRTERNFNVVKLSDIIRQEIHGEDPALHPSRELLQAKGNQIRESEGPGALVDRALQALDQVDTPLNRVVVDGIRNTGEIAALRDRFGYRFGLLGMLSDATTRWERVRTEYEEKGLSWSDFQEDDERDRGEDGDRGQQVAKCVDLADAILVNSETTTLGQYRQKVLDMSDLLINEASRPPTTDEIHMHMAFTSSHLSQCLKRHVGAIVVDAEGEHSSSGFNENPPSTKPCRFEEQYEGQCHRDRVRNTQFKHLVERKMPCPTCGRPLELEPGPPWRCSHCLRDGVYTNLEATFFPDRAISWCTAIHAEDRALRAAGARAHNATLYTTTFPCFQCADKIIMAGVREVVFVEAYPDPLSAERLKLAGVDVRQFEGVLSSAFGRIFATARPA